MTATEMHDLLKAAYDALNLDVWRPGTTPEFRHINYCKYCHYSESHGHVKTCLLEQLNRVTGSASGLTTDR